MCFSSASFKSTLNTVTMPMLQLLLKLRSIYLVSNRWIITSYNACLWISAHLQWQFNRHYTVLFNQVIYWQVGSQLTVTASGLIFSSCTCTHLPINTGMHLLNTHRGTGLHLKGSLQQIKGVKQSKVSSCRGSFWLLFHVTTADSPHFYKWC